MGSIFSTIIFEPLFNGLIYTYKLLPDLGIAIIILTVVIKLILLLPSRSAIVAQKKLQEMQPKMQEIQNRNKDNREEQSRQLMAFYKQHKVNPFSSCLPLLIQLPILIGLYQIFLAVAKVDPTTGILIPEQVAHLYPSLASVYGTTPIDLMSFGFVDLGATKNWIFAILAGAAQFWQSKMLMAQTPPKIPGAKDEGMASAMSKQMTYIFPVMIVYLSSTLPTGLALYWIVSTVFTIAQQYLLFRKKPADNIQPAS